MSEKFVCILNAFILNEIHLLGTRLRISETICTRKSDDSTTYDTNCEMAMVSKLVTLCQVMSDGVRSCHIVSCCVTHGISGRVILCHATWCHMVSGVRCIMSCHVTLSGCVTLFQVMVHGVNSCHKWCYVIPHCVRSGHIMFGGVTLCQVVTWPCQVSSGL